MDYHSCSCHEKAEWELGDWEDYWCLISNQPLVCQRTEGRTAVLLRGDPEQAAVVQPVRPDAQQSYTHKHNLPHCLSVTVCYNTHTLTHLRLWKRDDSQKTEALTDHEIRE